MNIKHGMILAAGLGSRLHPLTEKTPKCLLPIDGKPLLEIWLNKLHQIGIKKFLVNTHHLAEQVTEFVKNSNHSNSIELTYEEKLLGTAGTLIANLEFCRGETTFLIHADNYCLADLKTFMQAHNNRPPGCLLSMMTFDSTSPKECGLISVDKKNIVQEFDEKPD